MNTNYSLFKSRTFYTILAMFVVAGANAVLPVLPPAVSTVVSAILGIMAVYFHVNPSQTYNPVTPPQV